MTAGDEHLSFQRSAHDLFRRNVHAHRERRRVRARDAAGRTPTHPPADRQTFVDGDLEWLFEKYRGRNRRSISRRIGRKQRGIASTHDHGPRFSQLYGDCIARAIDGQTEDVESGTDVADGSRCENRRATHRVRSRRSWIVIAMMSLRTPAAVTSAPAPGPVTTSGLVL